AVATLKDRLEALARERPAAIAVVAAHALPHAEAAERAALAQLLLDMPVPAGIAAVIAILGDLDPGFAARLRDPRLELRQALAMIGEVGGAQGVLNAIEIARIRCDPALSRQLAVWVDHSEEKVAAAASRALLDVV